MTIWEGVFTAAIVYLAVRDLFFTRRRLRKYGVAVELNKQVARMYIRWGAFGLCLIILGPTAVLTTLALLTHSNLILGTIFGVRACLFDFQQTSLELERTIDELKKATEAVPPPRLGRQS